jgi:hypothetical protein
MPPGFFYVFANIEYTKMSRLGQKQPYVSYILRSDLSAQPTLGQSRWITP